MGRARFEVKPAETRDSRPFPVRLTPAERRTYPSALAVPWWLVAPHVSRALADHGRTIEQLAAEGGLTPAQIVALVQNRAPTPIPAEVAGQLITEIHRDRQAWSNAR